MLRCGLLGGRLGHSYSPAIHAMLGDYEYRLCEKTPEEVGRFLTGGDFDGLNVTIPYKKPSCPSVRSFPRRRGASAASIPSSAARTERSSGTTPTFSAFRRWFCTAAFRCRAGRHWCSEAAAPPERPATCCGGWARRSCRSRAAARIITKIWSAMRTRRFWSTQRRWGCIPTMAQHRSHWSDFRTARSCWTWYTIPRDGAPARGGAARHSARGRAGNARGAGGPQQRAVYRQSRPGR